jgi:ribonuclease P protein component
VYEGGRKVVGTCFAIFALGAPTSDGVARVGITATRKLGGAVLRNRGRRRTRELLRRHQAAVVGTGAEVVVNVRSRCISAAWASLEKDLLWCLRKLRRNGGSAT